MSPLRRALPGGAALRLFAAVVLAAGGAGGVLPSEGSAQTAEQLVAQRRLELNRARAEHTAAANAFELVDRQFNQALDEVNAARRSGDADRLERAFALAQDRSIPQRDQEARLKEAAEALVRARTALIEILSVRMEELVRQMDAAPSAQQRAQLNTLFVALRTELQRLEAEEQETFRLDPVALPDIVFDPRDGPDELRAKAEVLERRAALADTVIRDTERKIQDLNRRLRTERQGRDFLAAADRFDDTRVPVVTTPQAAGRPAVSDSTVASARPQTLEERIESLSGYLRQMQAYREELLVRARQFRQRVGSVA